MQPPFTGREAERRLIADLTERVAGGRPGALVLVGEAGVGKTRLLRETGVPRGVRRIDIVGYEPEAGVAFGAVLPLLETIDTAGASADASNAARLSEAAFRNLAAGGATLLVVDDLQWLDPSSLGLLHYLVRGAVASRRPIGLLAAMRPAPQASAAIAALERLFHESPSPIAHDLAQLGEREAVALVKAVAPGTTTADAEALWRRVGGSPYWLLALARAGDRDPTSVMSDRLRRLSADAGSLLSLLAVAGRPISASFAARVMRWPAARVQAAARELASAGLAAERADGLQPIHDLVRETITRTVPPAVKRLHHERLARTLEGTAGGDLQVLHAALGHRLEAGLPVVETALLVAESDRRRWLDREAILRLARIADEAPVTDPNRRRLALAVARLASEVGAPDVAFERWSDLAQTGPHETRAEAALAAAREGFRLRRGDDVERLLVGPGAPEWDEVASVEVGALRASTKLWVELRFPEGAELAREVVERARQLPADPPPGEGGDRIRHARYVALRVAIDANLQAGEWQTLRALGQELVAASLALDDRTRIEALIYERLTLRLTSDHRAAADRAARALRHAKGALMPDQMIEAGHFLALSLLELGRVEEAEATVREAAELAARVGDYPKLRSYPSTVLHLIGVIRGDWRTAVADIEADAAAQANPHFRLTHRWAAALALSAIQGERSADRVERLAALAVGDAREARCPRCLREALATTSTALARSGRRDAARPLLAEATGGFGGRPPEPVTAASIAWASALVEEDDRARTERMLEALPTVRRARGEIDGLWARIDAGRAMRSHDQPRAAELLRETGREAEAIGAPTIAHVADQLLRGLGHRTWRRSTGPATGGLTPRELEVARLVAGGASNRDVAAALFVSVKTVERHISNALAKVGARNRTELAERLRNRI